MKKYYINSGEQNLGPFDFNDLKSRGIDGNTLVWFLGLERWSKARSIPELKELFRTSWENRKEGLRKSIGSETDSVFKDRLFLFAAFGLILGFGILFYSFYITSSIALDEQQSHNELQESKELLLLDQVAEDVKASKNTTLLLLEDGKAATAKRKAQIKIELDMANHNLMAAEQELFSAKSFQFLRMSEVRQHDIETANKKIKVWQDEIKALNSEMKSLDSAFTPTDY